MTSCALAALLLTTGSLSLDTLAQAPSEDPARQDLMRRRAALEQKLAFANQALFQAAAARRVMASTSEDAKLALRRGRELYTQSRSALDAGNLTVAEDLANESLRFAAQATRLAPDPEQQGQQQRLAFDRLLNDVQAFQASQLIGLRQARAPGAVWPPELEQVRELVAQSQALAETDKYAEAWGVLMKAADLITGTAPRLMAERGLDHGPVPGPPERQFEIENARYRGYEDLMPIAVARFRPGPDKMREIDALVAEGRRLHGESRKLALASDFGQAAEASRNATARLRRALRIAGVDIQSE